MRAGRALLGERVDVSKERTWLYWDWWKAVCMFTSSGIGMIC